MKLLEWKCIAMNREKENKKCNWHRKVSLEENLIKGRMVSSQHPSNVTKKLIARTTSARWM